MTVPQTTVWTNPHLVTDPAGEARALAPVLGDDVRDAPEQADAGGVAFVYLARKVDDGVAAKVKSLNLDGVFSIPEPKRFLPAGELAAPVLGTVGLDNQALSGLEVKYDKALAGQAGPAGRRARSAGLGDPRRSARVPAVDARRRPGAHHRPVAAVSRPSGPCPPRSSPPRPRAAWRR